MILVTGGLGMIGAHTARALLDLGEDVVVTSHRRGDVPSFLDGKVVVESLDVTIQAAFLALGERYAVSDIVHLAGSVPADDPVAYFRTDMTGLFNALDAARVWGVRRSSRSPPTLCRAPAYTPSYCGSGRRGGR
ncbi:NAD-dependent epimerase/dehydratase family protein [Kribbella sp. NPDC050459]|uniref:NAD-dependent epimerase/dehydratase family protein n=1 Tax=Kribbella sp. NPDC050459 TaxID=3155785 RepID=UPI003411EE5A